MKSEKVEINPERCLGFLLVCVCAAEEAKRIELYWRFIWKYIGTIGQSTIAQVLIFKSF